MPRRVHVVPHTHWDREWYEPFQTFRLRLVDVVDDLLEALDRDPGFAHFLLDGQMAAVEDYLAVRPEAEATIRRLVTAGRLSVGPWYALPDEFLVSGETLVRNLQRGFAAAARFGGAMPVGYLPDMFGHVAQMPQLLRAFGLEHAVVWRGVPAAVDRSGFWWEAPNGSRVRAEYLVQGYSNGARVPDDAKELLRAVGEFVDEEGERLTGPVLWMAGTDHLPVQPWLPRVLTEANGLQDDVELAVSSLAEHLAVAPTEGLPTWRGELRSGARANLLMGVASNRVDVKVAAARAERWLERLAEPLCALLLPADRWPGALLDEAWLAMLRNSAHDSVCACSADEVCDAVLVRYAEAHRVAEGLARRAVEAHGAATAGEGPIVVNPSARSRGGVVEVRLRTDDVPDGCQLVSLRPAERVLLDATPAPVATVMVRELEHLRALRSVTVEDADDGTVLLHAERSPGGSLFGPEERSTLAALGDGGSGDRPLRVRVTNRPAATVLAHVTDLPGYGWRPLELGPAPVAPVHVEGRRIGNGVVEVEVDDTTGTLTVDGVAGLAALVDDGDAGDTYNWCPPEHDTIVDHPVMVEVEVLEQGPLRGRLLVRRRLALPAAVVDGHRRGEALLDVETHVEVRAGEDLVRLHLQVDHHGVRDHRLRLWFPLPRPAATSQAECAFGVVERGLHAEGGPTEAALATFPSRRFVQAGGLTVAHQGLLEYELVDLADDGAHAGALALTLVRATGMLSQGPMATRPLPAGPIVAAEGAQMQRPLEAELALCLSGRDPYAVVDDAFVPLQVTRAGGGDGPREGRALELDGAEVSAVVRDASGALAVRVHNPGPEPATVQLPGRKGWTVDLLGRPIAPFEGAVPLAPYEIATLSLDHPDRPA